MNEIDYKPLILEFFKTTPDPTDEQIHALATALSITPERFEQYIYELLTDLTGSQE